MISAQESIVWEKDINTAMTKARATHRLVFVHFYGENCPPCKVMDSDVFPNRQVIADMNRFFVPVKVDTSLNPQLVKQFDVKAIPADVVLKPDGQFVHRRQGGISAERFAVYLNYINEEAGIKNAVVLSETSPVVQPSPPTVQPPPPTVQPPPPTGQYQQPVLHQSGPPPMSAHPHPSNPWDVSPTPPQIETKNIGPVPQPTPVMPPVIPPNPMERTNPVRTGPVEYVAASPKGSISPLNQGQPIPEGIWGTTVEIPLALDGFCPVTLNTQERWQVGNPLYYAMYQGQIFRCINEETLAVFCKEPAKYAPVAMGEDIVQMVNRNKKVAGQRKFGAWFQDRVYLFSSQESLDAFAAKPEFYAEIAQKYETALRPRFDAVQR